MKYIVSGLALALAASAIPLDAMQNPPQPQENVLSMGVLLANLRTGMNSNTQVPLGVSTPVQDSRPMTHISCHVASGMPSKYTCKASLKMNPAEVVGTCVGTGTPSALNSVHNGSDLNIFCTGS